jgi:hypothetical protein
MTRIGFAYNQKPEPESADAAAELSRADEEPPSSGAGSDAATSTPSGIRLKRSTPSHARSHGTAR